MLYMHIHIHVIVGGCSNAKDIST